MIEIGFHTDAFNSSYWNFEQCLQWAQKNDVHWIECGMIDGVSWIHGLGYQPHLAIWEDPLMWREKAAKYGAALLPDRRRLPHVSARRRLPGRGIYPAHHPLGLPGRLRPHRYHRRPLRAQRADPRAGAGDDEKVLRPGHRSRRTLQDDHRYRTARLLHHQARVHGKNAGFCGQPLSAHEHGYRQHLHCRARPGGFPAEIQA